MGVSQRVITLYDKPMWDSIARGRMELQQCASCLRFRYPPGPTCPHCLSMDSTWKPVSGRGTILSWVVFHRQYFDDFPPPYNSVAVQLAEGPIVVSNLIGEEPTGSWIGREVEFVYREHSDRKQHAVRLVNGAPDAPREAAIRPLADITVVEAYAPGTSLALRLAGAMAGRIAADCGARVIVHEDGDDPLHTIAPLIGGTSAISVFLNTGKQIARGAAHLRDADVAIIDAASARGLRERPPVVATLSLFNGDADHPASEFTVMALGGLLDMVGDPARAPLALGSHQAAYAAGLAAYAGIAAALCRPRVGGKIPPDTVQISMLDTVIWLNWKSVPARANERKLTRTSSTAEWQVLRCADGFVALVYQEPDWAALCDIVDDARLRVPELAQRPERIHRAREIADIAEQRFASLTRREIHALALARRIPLGPIWSPREVVDDPQTTSRGFLQTTTVAGRTVTMPRLPVLWNGEPLGVWPPHAEAVAS